MITEKDRIDFKNEVSKLNNKEYTIAIASILLGEQLNPNFWDQLDVKFTDEEKVDFKNLLWKEASSRGISVSDVQSEISRLSKSHTEYTISNIKEFQDIRNAINKKSKINNAINIFLVTFVVIAIIYGIYYLINKK